MMNIMNVEEVLKKLKPIIGEKADEIWYTWLASDFQERKELEIDIGIIAEKALREGPLAEREILLPPPNEKQAAGDFILGHVVYRGRKLFPLHLREHDLIRQIGIYSITGGGKTNLSMLLALQLLKKGTPFAVVDWKRQWRSMLSLEGHPGLKKIEVYTVGRNVAPFLWNPFRPPPGVDYRTWISVLVECLERSHLAGLGVADFFMRIYENLFKEIAREDFWPNFHDGMHALEKIKVGGREFLWWQSTKRIFKSFTFGPGSKAFNARDPVKLEELLEKPVIFELDQELPKPLRVFFTELILRWIHLYRLSQGDSEQLRHCLFLEEVHNLVQQARKESSVEGIENVYRELRSTGQGLVSITQHPSLLPIYITGNSATLIFLALSHHDDVKAASQALLFPREDEAYLGMLKTGQGIVKVMERIPPCLVQFLYVPVEKGAITDEFLRLRAGSYLPQVNNQFSDDKETARGGYLPPDIVMREEGVNKVNNPGRALLRDVFEHPLSDTTSRYERLGLNPKSGNEQRKKLIAEGLIQPVYVSLHDSRLALYELTEKGRVLLRDMGYAVTASTEGVAHRFWKGWLAERLRRRGFHVEVEKERNGKADIVASRRGRKIAIEIESGESDVLGNLERDLKAGFEEILCVAVNEEVKEKLAKLIPQDKRIKLLQASEYTRTS